MNSRERILAALEGREADHLPFCPFLAYVWESFPAEVRKAGQLAFHHRVGADPLWRGAPCPVAASVEGLEVRTTDLDGGRSVTEFRTPVGVLRERRALSTAGDTWFLVEHPLKTEEDWKVRLWIEEHTRFARDPEPVARHFAGDGREGLSQGQLIPRGKSAWQGLVEHLAGTEELVYALADFPATVDALWRTMVARDLEAARLALDAPYEIFLTWEDSSTQNYSPALYDRYIATEIAGWCDLLAGAGKRYVQHACGHVRGLLPSMRRSGVLAVESLSPPPTGDISLREARSLLGASTGIIGGIEPTEFLNLPLARLGAYVEGVIADGAGGPFVLANSDSCPPGVTVEKFALVAGLARATPLKAVRAS